MVYFQIHYDSSHQRSVKGTKDAPLEKKVYKENTYNCCWYDTDMSGPIGRFIRYII